MRKNILSICVHILIWTVSFSPVSALAQPYQPQHSIDILTVPVEEENFTSIKWRVVPEVQENGSAAAVFYRIESNQSVCRLIFSNNIPDISWEGIRISPHTIQSGDLLIVPGIPIPCDLLPVETIGAAEEPLIYEARMRAGGRDFLERIQVTCDTIRMDEARQNGWLHDTDKDIYGLRLVKAINLRTGELMAQQVWADDDPWWIYEETPYRRSWQVR